MNTNRNRQLLQTFTAATVGVLSAVLIVPLALLQAADPSAPESPGNANQGRVQRNEEADIDLTHLTNEQLLGRFERAPFGSAMVMTGGGGEMFTRSIIEVCRYAEIWETQHQQTMGQDVTVREMIRRGNAILPDIHNRITHGQLSTSIDNPLGTWGSADLYGAYAYVAGQIGNRETVTVLIQLLREARMANRARILNGKDKATPRMGMFSSNTAFVVTHALWQLTGRRHAFSADEWEQYLAIFGDGFVPVRERSDYVPDPAAVAQNVLRLVSDPFESRERLIAQGPAIVPQLLRALEDATEDHAVQVAWVIDELEATQSLRPELRRRCFIHRLSQLSGTTADELAPLDDLARRRALEHLPFADFVEIALEVNERLPDALAVSMSGWLSFRASHRLQLKFRTAWASEAEVEAAVPVLVDAISSRDKRRRELGITFAAKLSLYSTSKPAALIEALRECWIENLDGNAGRIMAQFRTPAATQAVLDGLQANDLTILTQAVSFVDEIRLTPAQHPEVFLQLVEATSDPLPALRRNAVVSLRRRVPELLYSELDRLSRDPDERIRNECIQVLRRRPNRLLVDILFDMANDRDEDKHIRRSAVSALGDPEYRDHVDRLLLLLLNDDLQGYACSAIYDAAGSDSLAIFHGVLECGEDAGGFMYQYLERLTGARPEQSVEAWQEWFAANPDRIPIAR